MNSNGLIKGFVLTLFLLVAALGTLALRYLSSQSKHAFHLAILVLAGVVALAGGTAAGSFSWLGQQGLSRSTTSEPAISSANQSEGQDLQPPLSEYLVSREVDQASQPPERPRLSSRSSERPSDDIVETVAKKQATRAFTYEVAEGDTLLSIAQKFSITPETILWANDVEDGGELLHVGQSLTIVPVSGVLHRVKEGDTLFEIAFAHEASPEDIIEANALEEPYLLSLDQQIVVPGGRQVPPPAPIPPIPVIEHLVEAGENVVEIALMHDVDPIAIVRANGLADADAIVIGQDLSVPGGKFAEAKSSPVAAAPAEPPRVASTNNRDASPVRDSQPAPPPPSQKPSVKGDEIVAAASRFIGYKYTWGGHLPSTGFDCSGFTWYIYKEVGINIPMHDLWGQIRAGRAVKRDELLPGDLVFFQNTYQPGLSHSGIYVGGGRFISAASEGLGVRFDRLDDPYWGPRYFGASRPW